MGSSSHNNSRMRKLGASAGKQSSPLHSVREPLHMLAKASFFYSYPWRFRKFKWHRIHHFLSEMTWLASCSLAVQLQSEPWQHPASVNVLMGKSAFSQYYSSVNILEATSDWTITLRCAAAITLCDSDMQNTLNAIWAQQLWLAAGDINRANGTPRLSFMKGYSAGDSSVAGNLWGP